MAYSATICWRMEWAPRDYNGVWMDKPGSPFSHRVFSSFDFDFALATAFGFKLLNSLSFATTYNRFLGFTLTG